MWSNWIVASPVAPRSRPPRSWARRASVPATTPDQLAAGLAGALAPGPGELVIAFVSSDVEPEAAARALAEALAPAAVIGCTSERELDGRTLEGAAVAVALAPPQIRFGVGVAERLTGAPLGAGRAAVTDAAAMLGRGADELDPTIHVGVTLVDGNSGGAEGFCLGSAACAPRIGIVGASSSQALGRPPTSGIFAGGRVLRDAGLVLLLETDRRFAVVMSEHMQPTARRVVVTGADPAHRIITELDGFPAAARYHELLCEVGASGPLDNRLAAAYPFATYVGDRPYVRSIREVRGDHLHLAAAVDEGAVLRIMQATDLVGCTASALDDVTRQVGELELLLTFSCVARALEAERAGVVEALDRTYANVPMTGFHSFGEQVGPLLVNHTLVGLALGRHARGAS